MEERLLSNLPLGQLFRLREVMNGIIQSGQHNFMLAGTEPEDKPKYLKAAEMIEKIDDILFSYT